MQMTTHLSPDQNLAALGYTLPPAPAPGGNYVSAKQVGSIVYLSGVISTGTESIITGIAGLDRSIYEGYAAARACALTQLAVLKRELGSLDHVAEVLTVNGYVNAAPGFSDSPQVINGAPSKAGTQPQRAVMIEPAAAVMCGAMHSRPSGCSAAARNCVAP